MTESDPASSETAAPVTEVGESDPNADSPEGLAGDMGVSSERTGRVRGTSEEVTYAAVPTHIDGPEGDLPPEQSSHHDGRPDVNPDSPGAHESDPDSNPRHGV